VITSSNVQLKGESFYLI